MPTPTRVAAAFLPALVLVAGCGPTAPGTAASTASAAPSATGSATAGARTGVPPTRDAVLPWPTGSTAALQSAVDAGAQPWLLDPTDVALAYAAARGWSAATATAAPGTGGPAVMTVTVVSSVGTHVLALAQPGRTGNGGIWVVTADSSR